MTDQIDTTTTETEARHSIVPSKYKAKYAERAEATRGRKGLSTRRRSQSCCDWLADELAVRFTVRVPYLIHAGTSRQAERVKEVFDMDAFRETLELNGVEFDPERGNPGTFRMSGRRMLAVAIAEAGVLLIPNEDEPIEVVPPANWIRRILG